MFVLPTPSSRPPSRFVLALVMFLIVYGAFSILSDLMKYAIPYVHHVISPYIPH
jgi:hypothetical protein